jgi:hypothetical protein
MVVVAISEPLNIRISEVQISGDFKQIAVRVAEVEGSHPAESSITFYRTFFNDDPDRLQMGKGVFRWAVSDKAEIARARRRVCSFGVEGLVCLVEVDLLMAEFECPATFGFDSLKSEGAGVEVDGDGDRGDRENEVVEALYLHKVLILA